MSSQRTIIEKALGTLAPIMRGTVVAGGFVRDTLGGYPLKGDIDFFVEKSKMQSLDALQNVRWMRDPNNKSAYIAQSHRPNLHLIMLQRDPMDFIKERFDFVACCGAIELGSDREWFHERFEQDVKAQTLTINSTLMLTNKSMLRAIKFAKRGWHIDTSTIAHLVSACAMSTPVLRDALIDEQLLTSQLELVFEPSKGMVRANSNEQTNADAPEEVQVAREYAEPRVATADRVRAATPMPTHVAMRQVIERLREDIAQRATTNVTWRALNAQNAFTAPVNWDGTPITNDTLTIPMEDLRG